MVCLVTTIQALQQKFRFLTASQSCCASASNYLYRPELGTTPEHETEHAFNMTAMVLRLEIMASHPLMPTRTHTTYLAPAPCVLPSVGICTRESSATVHALPRILKRFRWQIDCNNVGYSKLGKVGTNWISLNPMLYSIQ